MLTLDPGSFAAARASARARDMHQAALAPATRKQYEHGIVRLLQHFWLNDRHVFSGGFAEVVGSRSIDIAFVRELLASASPDKFPFGPRFTAAAFEAYLAGLVKGGDTDNPVSSSSLSSHRSSLNHLFTAFKRTMPEELAASLKDFFKGSRRTHAQRRARGEVQQEGKDHLKFGLFCVILRFLLTHSTSDAIFSGLYLCLSWNLMCRAGNTATIMFQQMEWKTDSMTILFAHAKNNQEGDKQYPRHVYANPLLPEISVLVHLGIYWLTTGFKEGQTALFPGASPEDRYAKCFAHFIRLLGLAVQVVGEFLHYLGNLATHSSRKGGATYAASGTTCQIDSIS